MFGSGYIALHATCGEICVYYFLRCWVGGALAGGPEGALVAFGGIAMRSDKRKRNLYHNAYVYTLALMDLMAVMI